MNIRDGRGLPPCQPPSLRGDVRRRLKQNPDLLDRLLEARDVLQVDPHNTSREHNIRKLTDVMAGEGQWRIRVGSYRIRYDILGRDVVLYTFRHRREAY